MDPHQSTKLDPGPDPHQFADDKPKCMENEPFSAIFKVFSLYLEGRIRILIKGEGRIRISIKGEGRIRIRIKVVQAGSGSGSGSGSR